MSSFVKSKDTKIHPTAIVHEGAVLAEDVEVGPYSMIGEHVTIGSGCRIGAHCVLDGWTTIGKQNRFFTGAVIGSISQDLKYKGEKATLTIGDGNTFREYVTVNLGTHEGGGETRVGGRNLLMAYSHVAHDCRVGNDVVIANVATMGGHVVIEDKAILGGMSGFHQFVRVGTLALVGAHCMTTQDVVPFAIVARVPAQVYGVNHVGLERSGINKEIRQQLERAFRVLFYSGLSTTNALEKIEKELPRNRELAHLVQFIRASKRGICGGPKASSA